MIGGGSCCFPWSWLIDSVPWEHLCFGRGLLFFQRRRLKILSGLPEDLVTEILSRLPLMSVIRFRLVCKQWYELTSTTQSFLDMQYDNQPPTRIRACFFVVQYFDRDRVRPVNKFDLFFIEKNVAVGREIRLSLPTRYPFRFNEISLISSYRGFLLFTAKASSSFIKSKSSESALIFYNPVTGEQVIVAAPPSRYVYCGFYFHSPTKEYRVLFYQVLNDDDECMTVGFEILGLRTRLFRKINIKNKSAKYYPDTSTPAVISNGALHWMVSETHHKKAFGGLVPSCSETILSFGIESEEFRLMPHPGYRHPNCARYRTRGHKMTLLVLDMDIEGKLCVCDGYFGTTLFIWVLEDYTKWIWVLRHQLSLHKFWSYWPHVSVPAATYGKEFKVLQIHRGELLLEWHPDPFNQEYLLYPLHPVPKAYKYTNKNFKHRLEHILHHKKKRFQVVIDRLHASEDLAFESPWSRRHSFNVEYEIMGRIVVKNARSGEEGRMVGVTCSLVSLHKTGSIFSLHDGNQLRIIQGGD